MNLASDMFAPIHKHQRDTMILEHCLVTDSKIIGTYALKQICTKNRKIKANHKYKSVGVNMD